MILAPQGIMKLLSLNILYCQQNNSVIDLVIKHPDVDALSDVSQTSRKKATKRKVPSMDQDGNVKCTRAPNWHKDKEDRLIEKYMENR